MLRVIRNKMRNRMKAKVQGAKTMEKTNNIREIGQLMSVAIAAILFGSTMILSAVGPARASEAPMRAHPRARPNPRLASWRTPQQAAARPGPRLRGCDRNYGRGRGRGRALGRGVRG